MVVATCRKWSTPVSSISLARNRAAPASKPATAAEVASAGVPSGIVIEAVMNWSSIDGANWKLVRPPSTKPAASTRVDKPIAAAT